MDRLNSYPIVVTTVKNGKRKGARFISGVAHRRSKLRGPCVWMGVTLRVVVSETCSTENGWQVAKASACGQPGSHDNAFWKNRRKTNERETARRHCTTSWMPTARTDKRERYGSRSSGEFYTMHVKWSERRVVRDTRQVHGAPFFGAMFEEMA